MKRMVKTCILLILLCLVFFTTATAVQAGVCDGYGCTWVSCERTFCQTCGPMQYDCIPSCWTAPSTCCRIYQSVGSCTCCDGSTCVTGGCEIKTPTGDDDSSGPTSVPPTPTPLPIPGTIRAVAREVSISDTSCAAVSSSLTGISDTVFNFTASSVNQPPAQTQVGNDPVTFSDQPVGSYTIDYSLPDSELVMTSPCFYRNGTLVALGLSATLYGGGETIVWRLGFTRGLTWVQTEGGDVYASGMLRSYISPSVTPRVFNLDGESGYPGVVVHGGSIDFDPAWELSGETNVSSQNWLVETSQTAIDYYDFFYRRLGSPATPTTETSFSNPLAVTKPPSSAVPYYVVGDMTTSGVWNVENGESIVVIVTGNLTIGGDIRITGTTGFIAFIVNGNISVVSTVGNTSTVETPNVEGVYITSPTGTFITGESAAASTARFVGKGMFIAGDFLLQRDLEGFGVGNSGSSAELFIYNPQLLVTMPDEMKDVSVTWQEVAP